MNKQKEVYDSSRPKWTTIETKTLIELLKLGCKIDKISDILEKPENLVKARFYELLEEGLVEPINESSVEPVDEEPVSKKARPKWTEQETMTLIDLRKRNYGVVKISNIMNKSVTDVTTELRRGIKAGLIESVPDWTDDEIKSMIELLSQGVDLQEIARKLKKNYQTVYRKLDACAKEGLIKPENCHYLWTDDQIRLLLELKSQGMKICDIAEKLGKPAKLVTNKYNYYLHKGLAERTPSPVTWTPEQIETLIKLRTRGVQYHVIERIMARKKDSTIAKFHGCVKKGLAEHPDHNVIPWTEDETTTLLELTEQGVEIDTILEQLGRL
jgi:predicted transcriptional regulator